ncbi:MAG: insulinase family protein [Gemmatimonadetes bacterium]|nr:insulinase family protein [Gemmatimonadota bacterium]
MARLLRRLTPVVLGLFLLPALAIAQRAELEKILSKKLLPNGMEIVVLENHGVPLATVELNVRNGSFTQGKGYEGLAHLYEHMFFKANDAAPNPDEFVSRASDLGAVFNATTQEERVNYYMTLRKDSVEGAIKLMAAAMRTPMFLKEELEREREVVLGEYDRQESNPHWAFQRDLNTALYPGQYSRKNVIGDREILRTVEPEKLFEIQRKYYIPNNTVLIVTGDVKPAEIFGFAEAAFGDWKPGPDPFKLDPIPPIPPLKGNEVVITEQPVNAVTVWVTWQGPSVRKDPQATFAADVFSDVINQSLSTFQRRLTDTGLFQSVGFNYYTLDQVGPISIQGQTTPEKLKAALAALDKEITQLGDPGYITADQLEAAKAERAVSTAFGMERASDFAHTLGFWWSVADLEYYMGYIDNMAKQTLQDLQAYAKKYIIGKPRITGVLIDPESRKALGLTKADLLPRVVQ